MDLPLREATAFKDGSGKPSFLPDRPRGMFVVSCGSDCATLHIPEPITVAGRKNVSDWPGPCDVPASGTGDGVNVT